MKELPVQNHNGDAVTTVAVPDALIEGEVNHDVLHQVVVAHLANQRQGTASTKGRSEVRGSGRKLFRQKGLGRARMGNIRSPIRIGGGVAFGPKPRSYRQRTPKKMRRLALIAAVRDKFAHDAVQVVDAFPASDEAPRTKTMARLLDALGLSGRKVLIVLPDFSAWVMRSARNLPTVDVTTSGLLNAYDVLTHDVLLLLPDSVDVLAARIGNGSAATDQAEAS